MIAGHDIPNRSSTLEGRIASIVLDFPAKRGWDVCFGLALLLLLLFFISVAVLLWQGIGIFGNNVPVSWAFPIINYVWFLGIAHAGTLISALLLLTGTTRRNALNRFAEAMTLCAVICAALYPILHLGRPWLFYWMAPYPNTMGVWPQFKSPLSWDFFAVGIYLAGSLLFWFLGAFPDFAIMRDRAKTRRAQVFFGLAALGWRGSARHWQRWKMAYRLSAALCLPMVFGVTASYSLLFAAAPIPGWNSTIFPPYFLLGAVFSGFAVVAILSALLRASLPIEDLLTLRHLELIGKLMLATGLMTGYCYLADAFTALIAGEGYEYETFQNRIGGLYAFTYWGAVLLNFAPLQLLWWRVARCNQWVLAAIGLSVTVGMWLERFMLLVTGLYRDYLLSSWHGFVPTIWDWLLFAGMAGVFLVPFLLFVRLVPMMSIFEMERATMEARGE